MKILKKRFEQAVENYKNIKITHLKLKEIEKLAENKILADNNFKVCKEWQDEQEYVKDSTESYLLGKEDFQTFLDLRFEVLKKYIPHREATIDYKTLGQYLLAESNLVKTGYDIVHRSETGQFAIKDIENVLNSSKYREKAIEQMLLIDISTI